MTRLANAFIKARDRVHLASDRLWSRRAEHAAPETFSTVRGYRMFVGYPRSAHTVVGSLLNAHPRLVISHELNGLRYVNAGFTRDQLFHLILRKDREFTASGSTWSGYDYAVPGQWQGRYERLEVIGDKKAAASSLAIGRDPSIMHRLRELVRTRVFVIHVVRNPFDNIATMLRHEQKQGLGQSIVSYFRLCEGSRIAMLHVPPHDFITVRHELLLGDPRAVLTKLSRFPDVETPTDYLEAAVKRLLPSPRRSRHEAPWTPETIREVEKRVTEFEFLSGYGFDD